MKFLVTGANGFVGQELCRQLLDQQHSVVAALRRDVMMPPGVQPVRVGALSAQTDWTDALQQVDVVMHLAARVHVMQDQAADPLAAFRQVNTEATLALARQAVRMGVRRLVYVSSIKVHGESSEDRLTEQSVCQPVDPYGISKYEAEQGLQVVAERHGLEVVCLRPPLVYGPGVKGNFIQLLRRVYQGWPLPLAAVNNQRSLLYLGNLVDALLTAGTHQQAAGQCYLLSDGEPVSTARLIQALTVALNVPDRSLAIAPVWLQRLGTLCGKQAQMRRLLGSLAVDDRKIRQQLGWCPPYTFKQGIQQTADWFLGLPFTHK